MRQCKKICGNRFEKRGLSKYDTPFSNRSNPFHRYKQKIELFNTIPLTVLHVFAHGFKILFRFLNVILKEFASVITVSQHFKCHFETNHIDRHLSLFLRGQGDQEILNFQLLFGGSVTILL